MSSPYLSLVIATRNDEYPSNTIPVQGKCLRLLQRQLETAAIESEILVIEYNPDLSRPSLAEALRVDDGRYVTVKVIQVEARHHQRFRFHRELPFHQTCAINVGLQRSRGQFFVYRAADHIYSEQLIRFLAEKALREDTVYRCDRVDIRQKTFDAVALDDADRVSALCDGDVAFRFEPRTPDPTYRIPDLYADASGDFLLMARGLWMQIAGLGEESNPVFLDHDSLALYAAYSICRHQEILSRECCVYKRDHAMKTTQRMEQTWGPLTRRWDWLLHLAHNATLRNVSKAVFNYPRRVDSRLPALRLDSFERHFVLPAFLWVRGLRDPKQNRGMWGLAAEALPETVLTRAEWDRK